MHVQKLGSLGMLQKVLLPAVLVLFFCSPIFGEQLKGYNPFQDIQLVRSLGEAQLVTDDAEKSSIIGVSAIDPADVQIIQAQILTRPGEALEYFVIYACFDGATNCSSLSYRYDWVADVKKTECAFSKWVDQRLEREPIGPIELHTPNPTTLRLLRIQMASHLPMNETSVSQWASELELFHNVTQLSGEICV